MIFESIYNDVISSFGSLWTFKERGKSLEIITPFATTSQKFVSIFLTEKEGEYIVSDGGWICEGMYDNSFDINIDCFNKIFLYYKDSFKVKEVKNQGGISYFYKKNANQIAIPSLIFDMANFISALISLSNVDYVDKEKEIKEKFRKSASDYLAQIIPDNRVSFNEYLGAGNKRVKVSAVIRKNNGKIILLNYITGSHYDYFRTNISKTNIIFELAAKTKEREYIENKIALVDDNATGYVPDQVSIWLEHLISNTHSEKIDWTQKEKLQSI